jgi:hypothetical protein
MPLIKTAYSSHKKCFICNEAKSLHRIKKESIYNAFRKHFIIILPGTRSVLQSNGQLSNDAYKIIPVKYSNYSDHYEIIHKNINSSQSLFIKFRNFETLEDNECFGITRWTKDEFERFIQFIVSTNDNKYRSKNELIALYRYWLWKGIDHHSLSKLFEENTNKQRISDYLSQIRVAINKGFVPFYLDSKNRNRGFFIKHSTQQTQELFQLKEDDLCLIADGSYTRIEKSNNNAFQYNTWSEQKKHSLMKPFIVSCADGYKKTSAANKNDATILKYIFTTDEYFRKHFIPNKSYLFLDRGFNDFYFDTGKILVLIYEKFLKVLEIF